MSLAQPVLTGPRAGRTVTHGGGSSAELKLAGEQSGSDWAVVELHVRAGDEPPIHTHTREDETLYVLEGSVTAFVGDQRTEVDAGSYAALPQEHPAWLCSAWRGSSASGHAAAGGGGVLVGPTRRRGSRSSSVRTHHLRARPGRLTSSSGRDTAVRSGVPSADNDGDPRAVPPTAQLIICRHQMLRGLVMTGLGVPHR